VESMLKAELEKFKAEGASVEEVEIVANRILLPTPPHPTNIPTLYPTLCLRYT